MENASAQVKLQSIESFQSTIRKTEKALIQMHEKNANTTLVNSRLNALRTGLVVLEAVWEDKTHSYTLEDLAEARLVLIGLLSSIEAMYTKSKEGSPQKTLLERRITSLELAIQALNDLINE